MSKSSLLDKQAKAYIMGCVEHDLEEKEIFSYYDKLMYIRERFTSEFDFDIKHHGELYAMTAWLQGLALNVAYTHQEILTLAKQWGMLANDATEKHEDKFLENWFHFLANKLLQLLREI